MVEINIRELREQLAHFITQAEAGEEITITRRGKVVARLMPPPATPSQLPDLSEFRASITLHGEGLSKTVVSERRDTRY